MLCKSSTLNWIEGLAMMLDWWSFAYDSNIILQCFFEMYSVPFGGSHNSGTPQCGTSVDYGFRKSLNVLCDEHTWLGVHQQKGKWGFKNGPRALVVLHALHKWSEQHICNLLPCFEAFNDVIASSWQVKYLFNHLGYFGALVSFTLVL